MAENSGKIGSWTGRLMATSEDTKLHFFRKKQQLMCFQDLSDPRYLLIILKW